MEHVSLFSPAAEAAAEGADGAGWSSTAAAALAACLLVGRRPPSSIRTEVAARPARSAYVWERYDLPMVTPFEGYEDGDVLVHVQVC